MSHIGAAHLGDQTVGARGHVAELVHATDLELATEPYVAGLALLTDQVDVDPHHLVLRRDSP
jgi:hypothetical protein